MARTHERASSYRSAQRRWTRLLILKGDGILSEPCTHNISMRMEVARHRGASTDRARTYRGTDAHKLLWVKDRTSLIVKRQIHDLLLSYPQTFS